ncbi:MAG: membrane-bound lytic murein transglycosylase F [Sulfurimonas sp.]|jgi:membrane-bound lytic murein transglycosylase F|uniref:membrane-bound lytic murein transglycosylase MltF n=1 Tax=Sulfurimonas sp. TaxID=2022749 RepID=UPI0039E6A6A0
MKYNQNLFLIVFFAISFFLFGWLSHSAYTPIHKITEPSILDTIKKEKELKVVMLNAPSTYYIGSDGLQGFEYDLLKDYAKYLGVELNVTAVNTISEAIELSERLDFHIISAALSKTPSRVEKFNFGPSYFEVQQQVVCNRGLLKNKLFPRDVESLAGLKIKVGEGTSYSDTVRSLIKDGFDVDVTYTTAYSTEELLEQVSKNIIDCTIADSNIYALNLRYYPEMEMAFTISERQQLAWVLADDSKELEADMYTWLNQYSQRGKMAELKDHYYSNVHYFNYYDYKMLYKRIESRLPKYKKFFVNAGLKYGIQWKLLAAIAYQESHWNPNAKSFTGVRGMMMLTNATAKLLGIKNRVDPEQSIVGGTRHIKQMIKFVPQEVQGENRLKFALAAYNIGMGHVHDARKLAKRLGYNQNIWSDLKQVLPLLSKKKYYKTLKYGYARGEEPVKYVESIYDYRDILENHPKDIK